MSDNVSPINRLPPENLAEIFIRVQARSINPLERQLGYPWRLSLVCKLWRDVAYNTPQLWAHVRIALDSAHAEIRSHHDAFIKSWVTCLERSKAYPLTFSISAHVNKTLAFVPSFMTDCVRHASHWGDVVFGFPIDQLLPFISDPTIQYPRLHSLALRGPGPIRLFHSSPPEVELFKGAPLLSKLFLEEFPYRLRDLRLPWSQITEFTTHLNSSTMHDLVDVLREMPRIVSLQFSRGFNTEEDSRTSPTLVLPCLRRLAWFTYRRHHSLFFDSLCAPQLAEIEFQCLDENWDNAVERFLDRSGCTITSVKLVVVGARLASSFLTILRDVEVIVLQSVKEDRELLQTLTIDDSVPPRLSPKISRIVFENMQFVEPDLRDELVAMVASRLRGSKDPNRSGCEFQVVVRNDLGTANDYYSSCRATYQVLKERLSIRDAASVSFHEIPMDLVGVHRATSWDGFA